jgi:hypothetical protein
MSNENQIDESQIPKQNQSIDTIDASKFADAQSQLANLKENYELDRKLNIIKNSELSKLSDFRKFVQYLNENNNNEKSNCLFY